MNSTALKIIEEGQNRLILYPRNPVASGKSELEILVLLQECGFASKDSAGELLPGEKFMSLLTFVGCSPSVADADDSRPYNQYSVSIESSREPVVVASRKVTSPECKACRKKDTGSKAINSIVQEAGAYFWVCPNCREKILLGDINWRHKLAVASTWIQVNGVFEGEALPSEKFLDLLKRETGAEWSWCYC